MQETDSLESAIAEVERLRATQNAELEAAFAALTELGSTPLEVDVEQLRLLTECSEANPSAGQAGAPRPLFSFGRC